jgi:hypothetical protein
MGMKKLILGLVAVFLLVSTTVESGIVKIQPDSSIYYETGCVEGYKFLVIKTNGQNGCAVVQIFESTGGGTAIPMRCK